MKKTVELLKIGSLNQSVLAKLKKNLEGTFKEFNLSINIIAEAIPLETIKYNQKKKQYNTSKILAKILNFPQNKQSFRILGVIDEDIYSKSLNFEFGRAIIPKTKNPVALISITRLRESFYRRAEKNALFDLRVLKEAIHELGHTFSLEHCNNSCIMQLSNSITDTDNKPQDFCSTCMKKLEFFFKGLY